MKSNCEFCISVACYMYQVTFPWIVQVYLDIKMGNEELGRMVIGLFGDVVPKTALNFKTLAEGTMVGTTVSRSKEIKI